MDDFICYNEDDDYQRDEFPEGTIGVEEWEKLVRRLGDLSPETAGGDPLAGLRQLHANRASQLRLNCPRLFVSHRQKDVQPALRVAYIGSEAGFNFWLDVLDPHLRALGVGVGGTPYQQAVATAAVIEMALLNCTHVLAVITDNTAGTMWVPYEYGRVKDSAVVGLNASAWLDPGRTNKAIAEYMLLCPQHHSEADISQWLSTELTRWHKARPGAVRCSAKVWARAVPARLP